MGIPTLVRRLVAALVVAALAFPAAAFGGAGDTSRDSLVLRRDGQKTVPLVSIEELGTPTQAPDGFDWGDAALGLGVGTVIVGAGAVGVYTIRGHHARRLAH